MSKKQIKNPLDWALVFSTNISFILNTKVLDLGHIEWNWIVFSIGFLQNILHVPTYYILLIGRVMWNNNLIVYCVLVKYVKINVLSHSFAIMFEKYL